MNCSTIQLNPLSTQNLIQVYRGDRSASYFFIFMISKLGSRDLLSTRKSGSNASIDKYYRGIRRRQAAHFCEKGIAAHVTTSLSHKPRAIWG